MEYNWDKIKNTIKNEKFPISKLFIIFINIKNKKINIESKELNLIIVYFIKYHFSIFHDYPLYEFNILLKDNDSTKRFIELFYINIQRYYINLNYIKKFISKYNHKIFSQLIFENQINFLLNKKTLFLSYFNDNDIRECLVAQNKYLVTEFILERLKSAYKIFNYKFYVNNNINIFTELEFLDLQINDKIKFYFYFKNAVLNLLHTIINIYSEIKNNFKCVRKNIEYN
jgi:hypothetical protein